MIDMELNIFIIINSEAYDKKSLRNENELSLRKWKCHICHIFDLDDWIDLLLKGKPNRLGYPSPIYQVYVQ